uniref:Chorein N-terminal domain-containing protein n=1 Tax=Globisporangium ultimum (strain ATCC 200006 / CBS 805.95 / DAOM BR144) TaxID=431595 RepID=K3X2C4_GLOUD
MIYETLEQLLNEFFVDIHEENVEFSLGDLFDASHFSIRDVFLKTQIINLLHLPFEFAAGYIGNVKIEGLLGAVAGSPLNLLISDVCLVLRRKEVDWGNELLFRYSKEILIALLQSFSSPSYTKKESEPGKKSFISPAKWISNRFQAAIADMTIQFERIHVRLEGESDDGPAAYGMYIPTIKVASRDVDEQILNRRQHHGVTYQHKSDDTRSKLITFENLSVYCDMRAEKYYDPGSPIADNAVRPQSESMKPIAVLSKKAVLERFRKKVLEPFAPDPQIDLLYASEICVKLDLDRKVEPAAPEKKGQGIRISAIDIVTEALKLNLDFTQLSALNEELTRLSEFKKLTQIRQWRPSCVDRENITPPIVCVSNAALMPLLLGNESTLVAFPVEKQKRSKSWYRGMWRFATLRILVNNRKGNLRLVRISAQLSSPLPHLDEEERSSRYVELYTRNLSFDALQIIMHGKKLLFAPKSPQKPTEQHETPSSIPSFAPLTREEQWELSDLILHLPVHEQRKYRSMAESPLRMSKNNKSTAPSSPSKSAFFTPSSPAGSPRGSLTLPLESPRGTVGSPLASPSKTNTRAPDFPADYVANHHHSTRSLTSSPKKQLSTDALSPLLQLHTTTLSSASLPSAPTRWEGERSPQKLAQTVKKKQLVAPLSKELWVQQVFIPPSILKKNLPFLNWSLGPISLFIFRDNSSRVSPSSPTRVVHRNDLVSSSTKDAQGEANRSRDEFVKIGFERCSGAVLICSSTSSPSFLIELRLGLFHATLYSSSHQQTINRTTRNNSISSDYIKDPEDGFLYLGLKYNCKDGVAPATSPGAQSKSQGELKGKMYVGSIKIDYNEMTLSTGNTHPTGYLDIASSTYISIIHGVYRSFIRLLKRFRKPKQTSGIHLEKSLADPVALAAMKMLEEGHRKAAKRARFEKLLNAILLHSSAFEVEMGGLDLHVSLMTSHVEQLLQTSDRQAVPNGYEDLMVKLPCTQFGLQSKPLQNECSVNAAGAQICFRNTAQGRAAAIEYILRRLTSSGKSKGK